MNDIFQEKLKRAIDQNILVYNHDPLDEGLISRRLISIILGVAQRQFPKAKCIEYLYTDTEKDVLFDLFYDYEIKFPFQHIQVKDLEKTFNELGGTSYHGRPIILVEFDSGDVLIGCY